MWKTGTSSARRDAWAIGHNGRYAIGLWAGRMSGTGRQEFVGREAAEPLLAELMNLEQLRRQVGDDPAPSKAIVVQRPIAAPACVAGRLRIISPSNGDIFQTIDGEAIIHPASNSAESLSWFLNGKVHPGPIDRLCIKAGSYELRCVSKTGSSAAVRFLVR